MEKSTDKLVGTGFQVHFFLHIIVFSLQFFLPFYFKNHNSWLEKKKKQKNKHPPAEYNTLIGQTDV